MMGRQMLLFVMAVFFFGSTGVLPTARCRSPLTIDEAKSKLERLQSQLLRVEKEASKEKKERIGEQVDTAPKGEFETTKEYEARQAKASELQQQIADRIDGKKEARKEGLNRLINEVLAMEFSLPFEARLGAYNADTQIFPLLLLTANQESMFVPRFEAKRLKDNFSQAERIGTFALQLDAENHAKEYLISANVIYEGRSYLIGQSEMNVARAMFMLYGNYNSTNRHAKWRSEPTWEEEPNADYKSLEAISIFNASFREKNTNKFVLVTASVDEGYEEFGDCHGCGVKMGIAVFYQNGSVWKMELGQKDVGTYGESGMPPEASLVKIGPDRYALRLSYSWTNMGGNGVVLYFMDRVNGIFKEMLSLHTTGDEILSVDTTGDLHEERSYDSKIEYIPGGHSSYFDIRVTMRGKLKVKVKRSLVVRPFVEVKVYKFSNDAYKLSQP